MGTVRKSALLRLFVITAYSTLPVLVASNNGGVPPNHPGADLIKGFGGQLRCPYADLWLSRGPRQAAIQLGLEDAVVEDKEQEGATLRRSLQQGAADTTTTTACELAPGPAGAGHQAAFSTGYLFECPGTPAEGSPYQWPLMWSANIEQQSVPFRSDEVVYESRGQVWYRLDKNWKRLDTTYSRGVQRAVGQSLCPPENIVSTDPVVACRRDSELRRTMLHRQSKMYFINWQEGTTGDDVANIESCTWLDLQIVGNIRPDWFMDARGEVTDVQYLGDQHLYYEGMPKLVKQWRKKDFANQYFVMSMLGNPGEDGVHWPLILNVPGEGFGDDFLQKYTNHTLLTEEDEGLFLLDQALEAAGRSCPQLDRGEGEGATGPPVGGTKIPSNLEIDPNSWCTKEFTFSPVWEPPNEENATISSDEDGPSSFATTEVDDIATVGSCYDSSSGSVRLRFNFAVDVEVSEAGDGLPWMAVGYRQDAECLMIPKDGSDTEIILIGTDPASTETIMASKGAMSVLVRSGDPGAIGLIYPTLSALENADGYSNVKVSVSESANTGVSVKSANAESPTSVTLDFSQDFEERPEAMYMMYAIGASPQLGYHESRHCFEITEFPECQTDDLTIGGSSTSAAATALGAWSTIVAGIFSLGLLYI